MNNSILYWTKSEDSNEFICTQGDYSGMILSKKDLEQMFASEIVYDNISDIQYAKNLGLSIQIKIQKYKGKSYNCINIKNNCTFGKVFRVNIRELVENSNMSDKCWTFISKTEPYIHFPTNAVAINSANPTLKQLENLIGFGRTKLYDTLKELEENEVIKKIKNNGDIIIYYNPFLYCSGKSILVETYDMFKDSKYNK